MSFIYLLTDHRYLAPSSSDWYTQQILDEDALLTAALMEYNIVAKRVNWADPAVDWSAGEAAVFRTTWDYFERYEEFNQWLEQTQALVPFINPYHLIQWNLDKHYLLDLAQRGFDIVPSLFIDKGDDGLLATHVSKSGWDEVILKPCISGGAYHTYKLSRNEVADFEPTYSELISQASMMLQEYHSSIKERGEVSHMVLGGQYTHSILKRAKGDDFRVQDDFGGTVHPYVASIEERKMAERVFASCKPTPVYGRLDIMWSSDGQAMISELEIIEPELWLRNHPQAAHPFANGIARALEEIKPN